VAGFLLECVAGFVGNRNPYLRRLLVLGATASLRWQLPAADVSVISTNDRIDALIRDPQLSSEAQRLLSVLSCAPS
jgi:hypothetical protein